VLGGGVRLSLSDLVGVLLSMPMADAFGRSSQVELVDRLEP